MIKALSYIGFTSPETDAWKSFGPDMLGLEVLPVSSDGAVRLRNDHEAWRIAIHPGDSNDVAYLGWDVGTQKEFQDLTAKLVDAGIDVNTDDGTLANERAAAELAWFIDPFGFRHELTYDRASGDTPFTAGHGISGFVTGEGGLGHAVIMVSDLKAATAFYSELLGFQHSDDIEQGIFVRFLHCNPRHHSLALTEIPGMRGFHHLMIEVEDVDDVGLAYDRVNEAGCRLAMTLGRHPNDEMTSFYVRTPSGFEIEFGAGGKLIDMNAEWPVTKYDAMSIWGHKPPAEPLAPGILQPV